MNRKSKATETKKKKKRNHTPDEVLSLGPLHIARFGRTTLMQSKWNPAEFRRFRESLPAARAKCESSLQSHISTAINQIQKSDPIELLAAFFVKNSIGDPTTYVESSSTGKEYLSEYVFSTFAAIPIADLAAGTLKEDTLPVLESTIEHIFSNARDMMLLDPANPATKDLQEFRVQMFLQHLLVRGDSYPDHHIALVRAFASPHDAYLQKACGFTSTEMIQTFQAVEAQIQKRLDAFQDWVRAVRAVQVEALAKLERDTAHLEDMASEEDVRRYIAAAVPEQTRQRIAQNAESIYKTGRDLLTVDLNDPLISRRVVEAFACTPGDNAAFLSPPFAGYPTKDTIIWAKPFVRLEESFFCPSPPLLFRSMLEALDGILLKDKGYAQTYQSARGATLEKMAVEFLQRLLPGCQVSRTLYYTTPDGKRPETDAIIQYDRYVFVVEAKAGGLSLPARRGAPSRLKHDFGKIIEDAFIQGNRVQNYIMDQDEAIFTDERGASRLTLRRSEIDQIYIINPTLASMNPLGAQLGLAREKGLLSAGVHWPWCVFISDLRVVSEMIESPSEFILFLQRRLAVNQLPYAPHDELDLLCKFLADGLYHEPGELKKFHRVGLHGYTDMLDRWYIGRPHGAAVAKPARPIPAEILRLVSLIEATNKPKRTMAAIRLLELDQDGLDRIHAFLKKFREECAKDGKEHDLSMQFLAPNRGFSIYVSKRGILDSNARKHSTTRMCLASADEWLSIGVSASDDHVEFVFFTKSDVSAEVGHSVERIRRERLSGYVEQHGRPPGRNDLCTCSSGRKFKKCCSSLLATCR
ncbi:SEC-C metal-binding domain-containing protein [Sorangium sp. So ce887]|uniref:SEC-C metal-binding domain-containing protein n=1 Tax=Sorangium sp. So ce887 TaxID=3133324 RepID=UPI003F633B21